MKKIFFSFLCILIFLNACTQNQSPKLKADSTIKDIVSKHQILLTNYAVFKKHKEEMWGASSFLINYNDKIYAVTAKHLLGEAMGINPEIKAQELNKYLIKWEMYPRIPVNPEKDTVEIICKNLNYKSLDKDILLLETANSGFAIFPLTPKFKMPEHGDKLYIIGCPYSQENCRQNIYEVTFDSYDEELSMLNCIIKTKFEIAGFSGAPVLDSNGNVVGVLTSGWEEGKVKYVGATFIKEIQKVE